MQKEINIRLNVNRAKAVHTGHKFASGDKGIVFKLAVDELDTTNTTAKIVFKRSNGTSVEAGITAEDGIYSYTTLGNEFAVVGQVTADVKFYEGEKRISTCTFVFDVVSDTLDGIGTGTGGYSDTLEKMKKEMEEILAQMKEVMDGAEEDVEAAEKKMADLTADLEALYQEYVEAFGSTGPFNPRGPYSETESYTVRDLVTYDDASWVCYRNCTGATPSKESDCWQYFAVGAEVNLDDYLQKDSTATGASTLVPETEIEDLTGFTIPQFQSWLDDWTDKNVHRIACTGVRLGFAWANMWNSGNTTDATGWGGGCTVIKIGLYASDDVAYLFHYYKTHRLYFVVKAGTTWGKIQALSNLDELANYLPLTGGTVANANIQPMFVQRNGNGNVYLGYKLNGEVVGGIGFSAKDKPAVYLLTSIYDLLHTGNKPTGSYTGNGSATERTINVGGIGKVLHISGGGYGVFVDYDGAIAHSWEGGSPITFPSSEIKFRNGVLTMASASSVFNLNGTTFTYDL